MRPVPGSWLEAPPGEAGQPSQVALLPAGAAAAAGGAAAVSRGEGKGQAATAGSPQQGARVLAVAVVKRPGAQAAAAPKPGPGPAARAAAVRPAAATVGSAQGGVGPAVLHASGGGPAGADSAAGGVCDLGGYGECVVCWEAPSSAVLIPCGHLILCAKCAHGMFGTEGSHKGGPCPMCREDVLSFHVL